MATVQNLISTSFQQALPLRSLMRGSGLASVLFAAGGAFLLATQIFVIWLTADLVLTRGQLRVAAGEAGALQEILASQSDREIAAQQRAGATSILMRDRGILPAVWSRRSSSGGLLLNHLYRLSALRSNEPALLLLVGAMLLTGWLRLLARSFECRFATRASLNLARDLRAALHRQTLRLAPSEIQVSHNGRPASLLTTDVDRMQEATIARIRRTVSEPLQLLVLFCFALWLQPLLAVRCFVVLILCWVAVRWLMRRSHVELTSRHAERSGELSRLARTQRNAESAPAFGTETEKFAESRFQKQLVEVDRTTGRWLGETWERRWGIRTLQFATLCVILYWIAEKSLNDPAVLGPSQAVAFLLVFAGVYQVFINLGRFNRRAAGSQAAAERIQRFLSEIPEVGQAVGAKFLQPLSSQVEFENVTYAGNGRRKRLDGCSLKILSGSRVAVVATDPLDAKTLALLLLRFIEPHPGRVLIDGEDISWATLESLRAEVMLVGGESFVFAETVLDNICCGEKRYSLEDATQAAKLTHAHNFIAKLPHGYDTVVGDRGHQLNAGQRFRLGLTRAILRNPALLIVEEPTEPVDSDTKALLDDAYCRITRNRTVIFLPTRMSTLRKADEIVFLHEGQVQAIGNHAALVKSSPLYRHWEYVHFNEFRAEAAVDK